MGAPKAPPAPDPVATARAQGAENRNAAVSSQLINMVDQYGPDGSNVFSRTGEESFSDGNGGTISVPRFALTTTLNPTQQAAKDAEQRVGRDTNLLAETLLGKARGTLSTPTDYSDDAIAAKTARMVNPRLDDRFTRDKMSLETGLINRGIRQGSQAYTDAITDFEKGRTDAYSQEALANRQQAIQELGLGQRDVVNQIGALLGTGQISEPQFQSTPRANVAAPDYAGLVYQNYQGALDQYKQKQSSQNALLGGLFSLAGTAATAGFKYSDRRLKTAVTLVGTLPNGLRLYDYMIFGRQERGVMADEVRSIKPHAVTFDDDGFMMVDYAEAMA